MSSILTLFFAPSFILLIRFFDFKSIVIMYIFIALAFLVYTSYKKKKLEDFLIIGIYLAMLLLAYFYNDFNSVKFIPFLSALAFFAMFTHSAIKKKELVYRFTTKFYKKRLSEEEIVFLKNGDLFWSVAIFIYAIFLFSLIYMASDEVWAFFSSIGWYIYFILALSIQITYGKMYALKMLTK